MDGKYTQEELNHLINRLRNLEAQGRDDQGAKEEIANLKYEIQWAKNHLKQSLYCVTYYKIVLYVKL